MVGLMLWVESELEGCCGGFVCVSVCVLLGGLIGNGGLGCGFAVCAFYLVGLLVAAMVEVVFFVCYGMGGRFVVVVVWVVSFW